MVISVRRISGEPRSSKKRIHRVTVFWRAYGLVVDEFDNGECALAFQSWILRARDRKRGDNQVSAWAYKERKSIAANTEQSNTLPVCMSDRELISNITLKDGTKECYKYRAVVIQFPYKGRFKTFTRNYGTLSAAGKVKRTFEQATAQCTKAADKWCKDNNFKR